MAKSSYQPGDQGVDVPNLEEFQRRVEQASGAVDQFSQALKSDAATFASSGTDSSSQPPQIDPSLMRDMLNVLHLIHDEVSGLRQAVDKIMN